MIIPSIGLRLVQKIYESKTNLKFEKAQTQAKDFLEQSLKKADNNPALNKHLDNILKIFGIKKDFVFGFDGFFRESNVPIARVLESSGGINRSDIIDINSLTERLESLLERIQSDNLEDAYNRHLSESYINSAIDSDVTGEDAKTWDDFFTTRLGEIKKEITLLKEIGEKLIKLTTGCDLEYWEDEYAWPLEYDSDEYSIKRTDNDYLPKRAIELLLSIEAEYESACDNFGVSP